MGGRRPRQHHPVGARAGGADQPAAAPHAAPTSAAARRPGRRPQRGEGDPGRPGARTRPSRRPRHVAGSSPTGRGRCPRSASWTRRPSGSSSACSATPWPPWARGPTTAQVHTSDGELTVTLTRVPGAGTAVIRTPDGELSGPDHLVDIASAADLEPSAQRRGARGGATHERGRPGAEHLRRARGPGGRGPRAGAAGAPRAAGAARADRRRAVPAGPAPRRRAARVVRPGDRLAPGRRLADGAPAHRLRAPRPDGDRDRANGTRPAPARATRRSPGAATSCSAWRWPCWSAPTRRSRSAASPRRSCSPRASRAWRAWSSP